MATTAIDIGRTPVRLDSSLSAGDQFVLQNQSHDPIRYASLTTVDVDTSPYLVMPPNGRLVSGEVDSTPLWGWLAPDSNYEAGVVARSQA